MNDDEGIGYDGLRSIYSYLYRITYCIPAAPLQFVFKQQAQQYLLDLLKTVGMVGRDQLGESNHVRPWSHATTANALNMIQRALQLQGSANNTVCHIICDSVKL